MKLADLHPDMRSYGESSGVEFDCPCKQHRMWIPFGAKGWTIVSGSTVSDITLSPSMLNGCGKHFYIRNGVVVDA